MAKSISQGILIALLISAGLGVRCKPSPGTPIPSKQPQTAPKVSQDPYANRISPPKYELTCDGTRLYLNYDCKTFDIKAGTPNAMHCEETKQGGDVQIKRGQKILGQQQIGAVMGYVWSEKNEAFFIVTNIFDNSGSEETKSSNRCQLWQWTEVKGFTKLLDYPGQMFALDGSPREFRMSADENFLAFKYMKISDQQDREFVTYQVSNGAAKIFPVKSKWSKDWTWLGFSVLDGDHIFISGSPAKIFDGLAKTMTPTTIPGGTYPLVNFQGEPWAINFVDGKYRVVRLNSAITKIEQIFELPADFPKPRNPPDYLDGGD